ncbi:3-methyladenine DNA glycosylase [Nocardia beijingensis]|uniref:3-methyladenine DNA glycosylase n=1 Tax=Nocardia beijingensis TaxID=95162 RepID=UPI001893933A|nr:3-methyladenine DNA glycosylase [Nocardia beijingensis]MBF6469263.1 3-methyladenine DNA glycosylase [Nocardia beijingensis]
MRVLSGTQWRAAAAAHRARLDGLVGPYLERRAQGSPHPVIDFLFTYYGHKPAQLRRWHPGYGLGLADAAEYQGARGYHRVGARPDAESDAEERAADVYTADPAYLEKRRDTLAFVADLLRATASRPAQLACFGLHEWAMVYRTDDIRHQKVPLRLGRAGTDAVVDSMSLRCTHFDAYRFFTPDAVGRNAEPLTRADQLHREQPGCLHANMDLYKWGFKLVPLISSQLLLDCFALACAARELDMRASPYDLSALGYEPVRIETPAGRAEYVRAQSALAQRAAELRRTFLGVCDDLLASHTDAEAARRSEPTHPR